MPDARWNDPREYDDWGRGDVLPRVYGERDRDDPRDSLIHDLDLPRGEERELVVDRDRVYELNGEDSRALAAVGTFRVVPEQDLDTDHDTVRHLRNEGLIETVDPDEDERGLTLTKEGRDLLDSHRLERDSGAPQAFHAGVSRPREIDHDANLYPTFCQEEARLRDEHPDLEITRAGMRAALGLGRWTFPAPLGYLNAPKWSKTSLVHDPERGPLVRRAFEDLATGNYTKQEVIARATEAGLRSRRACGCRHRASGR
jgi:hypothetical protein